MSRAAIRSIALALLAVVASGCGDAALRATRYKAERLLWQAERVERRATLDEDEDVDSTEALEVREEYLRLPKEVAIPRVSGGSDSTQRIAHDIARLVVTGQLQAARLSTMAKRPDLALGDLEAVIPLAGNDTTLLRQADFHRIAIYRQFGRTQEALALMREMMNRYEPKPPVNGNEDAILAVPDAIMRILRQEGDPEGANRAIQEGLVYYRALLTRPHPPELEAQIRARLIHMELEGGDWEAGFRNLEALKRVAATTPHLDYLKPELQYTEAKLVAMRPGASKGAAVAMLDRFVKENPTSRFASRALFEAGALLEGQGKKSDALERYKLIGAQYADQPEVAPLAQFRRAMLEDQLGEWERAKNLLEAIPVRYPESQAAIEAPIAVARRYYRIGNREAGQEYLRKAIGTYEGLIARDTTTTYGAFYRWAILQCVLTLDDAPAVFKTVDEMARLHKGHPFTAQALLTGAQLARKKGNLDRTRIYLRQFLADYPNSPYREAVQKDLERLGSGPVSKS
jgi:outer membrane protein assembly factor BamD (BamD/ComL family)